LLIQNLKGDVLEVGTPEGKFTFAADDRQKITPLYLEAESPRSFYLKSVLKSEPKSLCFGIRKQNT
jgi:hypothetical protein